MTALPLRVDGGANAASPTQALAVAVHGTTVGQTLAVGDAVNVNDAGVIPAAPRNIASIMPR